MTPDIIINGKALYTTKGAAREYGRIGCNFYTGCPHDCAYCYLKRGAPSKQLGGTEKECKEKCEALESENKSISKALEQCQRMKIELEQEVYCLKQRGWWARLWNK